MISNLNPEAPEFRPAEVSRYLQNGFLMMNKTIRLSNNLPVGAAYKKYGSVSDFDLVTQKFSHNVFYQLNRIFVTELSSVRLKEGDYEFNMERITDANDSILDRTYINIECVNKGVESNQQTEHKSVGSGGYHNPVITTTQITRPQLYFKEPVDNTTAIWKPKIRCKHNYKEPLALKVRYNQFGEAIGYLHPYQKELELFEPKSEWLKRDVFENPTFPPLLQTTELVFINTEAQMDDLVKHLNAAKVIAVDLEHHSYRSYLGLTCLIQLTTCKGDFIIDALAVREHVHKLNEPFTNPNILKIFHGAEMDIQWLQRDFSVYVVGMFDTHKAAVILNLEKKSLAALLEWYCHLYVDKRYQLADWRLRPITKDMEIYARTDTHYLIYIWKRMSKELLGKECNEKKLRSVFQLSTNVCQITYTKPTLTDDRFWELYSHSKKYFNNQQMVAFQRLFQWRDAEARALDESTIYLLPNHMLLALAEQLPVDEQGICAVCHPMPPFVRQSIPTISRMMSLCRKENVQPQNPSGNENLWSMQPTPNVLTNLDNRARRQYFRQNQGSYNPMLQGSPYPRMVWINGPYFPNNLHRPVPYRFVNLWNGAGGYYARPFDRYQQYRTLAQIESLKQAKEKTTSSAPKKSNELVKPEVLYVMKQTKAVIEDKGTKDQDMQPSTSSIKSDDKSKKSKKTSRKKKIKDRFKNNAQGERRPSPDAKKKCIRTNTSSKLQSDKVDPQRMDSCSNRLTQKRYVYENAKYMRFRNTDPKKIHKKKSKK